MIRALAPGLATSVGPPSAQQMPTCDRKLREPTATSASPETSLKSAYKRKRRRRRLSLRRGAETAFLGRDGSLDESDTPSSLTMLLPDAFSSLTLQKWVGDQPQPWTALWKHIVRNSLHLKLQSPKPSSI